MTGRNRGQGTTEYVILIGVIALGSFTAVSHLKASISGAFNAAIAKLERPVLSPVPTSSSGIASSSRSTLLVSAILDASGALVSAPTGFLEFRWSPATTAADGSPVNPADMSYKLHYGTSPGSYVDFVDVGHGTSHRLTGLEVGKTYYFVVSTYDLSGNESTLSNEVSKVVTELDEPGDSS